MRKTLRIMNQTGDAVLDFDEADPAAVAKARAEFDKLMERHATVVALAPGGGTGEHVRKFEELAADNVVVPAIVAG